MRSARRRAGAGGWICELLVLVAVAILGSLFVAGARGKAGVGRHETLAIAGTTRKPSASTGLRWQASYHAAGNPHADPPALRRLVIQLPPGTRYDTSVPGRCAATDTELMALGDAACPRSSRVGTSAATVKLTGAGAMNVQGLDFNGDHQLIELFESGGRPVGIARTYANGTTLSGPVPTCVTGGNPPKGCPFDQLILLSNTINVEPLTVGHGANRRNYATTPATCPRSRRWVSRVTFYYADGSVDHLVVRQRCDRPRGGGGG